jgi:hypothetical protein
MMKTIENSGYEIDGQEFGMWIPENAEEIFA